MCAVVTLMTVYIVGMNERRPFFSVEFKNDGSEKYVLIGFKARIDLPNDRVDKVLQAIGYLYRVPSKYLVLKTTLGIELPSFESLSHLNLLGSTLQLFEGSLKGGGKRKFSTTTTNSLMGQQNKEAIDYHIPTVTTVTSHLNLDYKGKHRMYMPEMRNYWLPLKCNMINIYIYIYINYIYICNIICHIHI